MSYVSCKDTQIMVQFQTDIQYVWIKLAL